MQTDLGSQPTSGGGGNNNSKALTCRVCGASAEFDRYEVREMNFGSRETFSYLKCAQCESLQMDEVPGDLKRHYPPDYLGSPPTVSAELEASIRASIRK